MTIKFKHSTSNKILEVSGNFKTFKDFQNAVVELGFPVKDYTLYEHSTDTYYKSTNNIPNVDNIIIFMTSVTKKVRSGAFTKAQLYNRVENDIDLKEAIFNRFFLRYDEIDLYELEEFITRYDEQCLEGYDEVEGCSSTIEERLENLEIKVDYLTHITENN